MKKKIIISSLSFFLLATLAVVSLSSCASSSNAKDAGNRLNPDAVKSIALMDAGISESEIGAISIFIDDDSRTPLYEVEFTKDGMEYDYRIHAQTGEILGSSKEPHNQLETAVQQSSEPISQTQTQETVSNQQNQVPASSQENTQPATSSANTQQSSPQVPSASPTPTPQPVPTPQSAPASTGDIGLEQAKQIALSQVPGSTAANIIKAKRDVDDGIVEYDIEIVYDTIEYEFEIRGTDGAILEKNQESVYD